jgi:hypothetical protein
MTSTLRDFCPTTDTYKGNEIRVPAKLILNAFKNKQVNNLEILILLKSIGSRINQKSFFRYLGYHSKTGKRITNKLIENRWVGFDGKYIFPRSWSRIGYKKKKGLYLGEIPKGIKEYLFTHALKEITRRAARAQIQRSATPKGRPARYLIKSLSISERSYYRLLRSAIKRGLLRTKQTFTKVGSKKDFSALTKHLHGVPLFVRGNYTVTPNPCEMIFKI